MTGKSLSNKAKKKGYIKACVRQGKDLNFKGLCMKTSVCHWDQFTGRLANLKIAKQTLGISTSGAPSLNGCNIWKKNITDHLGLQRDSASSAKHLLTKKKINKKKNDCRLE